MECNLVFDIETIPDPGPLNKYQAIEFKKRILSEYNRSTSIEDINLMANGELVPNEDFTYYKELSRKIRAVNPYLGKIVCIGLMSVEQAKFGEDPVINKFALTGTEEKILTDFWQYLAQPKRFRFISYNGLGFDIPWIIKRSMKYGIRPTNDAFLHTKRYQRWPHYDVMQILADWDRKATVSIALACETFGIESPKEGEISAQTVDIAFKEGKIQEIAEYCIRDLDATYKLFKLTEHYQPK